jgi:hypothetical protein
MKQNYQVGEDGDAYFGLVIPKSTNEYQATILPLAPSSFYQRRPSILGLATKDEQSSSIYFLPGWGLRHRLEHRNIQVSAASGLDLGSNLHHGSAERHTLPLVGYVLDAALHRQRDWTRSRECFGRAGRSPVPRRKSTNTAE